MGESEDAPLFYAAIGTHMQISEKRETYQNQLNVNKNIYIARQYTYIECISILSVPSFSFNYCINSSRQDLEGEFNKLVGISFRLLIIFCIPESRLMFSVDSMVSVGCPLPIALL